MPDKIDLTKFKKLSGPDLAKALVGKTSNSHPTEKLTQNMGLNEYFYQNNTYRSDTDRVQTGGRFRIDGAQVCIFVDNDRQPVEFRSLYRSSTGQFYFLRIGPTRKEMPWKVTISTIDSAQ